MTVSKGKKKEKDKKFGFLFCKFYIWDKRNKHIVSYKARRSRGCGVKKISQSEALFAFSLSLLFTLVFKFKY